MWLFEPDIWREVYTTLTKNLMRTILTTLGVLFAVMILILLLGSTNGIKNGFNKLFEGTATNSMFVWSQRTGMPYKGFERGRRIRFTFDDVELIWGIIKEFQKLHEMEKQVVLLFMGIFLRLIEFQKETLLKDDLSTKKILKNDEKSVLSVVMPTDY